VLVRNFKYSKLTKWVNVKLYKIVCSLAGGYLIGFMHWEGCFSADWVLDKASCFVVIYNNEYEVC